MNCPKCGSGGVFETCKPTYDYIYRECSYDWSTKPTTPKKLKIANNPFDKILDIFENNYPEIAEKITEISFANITNKNVFGSTEFQDNGKIIIHIGIKGKYNKPLGIEDSTEILAHELAHAIAGIGAEHNQEWENAFERLHQLYMEVQE